jgi:prepilin-type N-terminal cleavage/methylation domain-containing protein
MGKCPKRVANYCCETRLLTSLRREVKLTSRRDEKGFTLIEVIVAIAVVAILAGIITPSVVKHLEDSRRARAQNDCLVIGSAVASFFKDVARMPNMNAAGNVGITLLVSQGNVPNGAGWNTAPAAANCDLLSNHLSANTPKAQAGRVYPTLAANPGSQFVWRGPYANEFPPDPWGNRYAVNIGNWVQNNAANANPVWVLSAGPDGIVQTPVNPAAPAAGVVLAAQGDDIVYRIR